MELKQAHCLTVARHRSSFRARRLTTGRAGVQTSDSGWSRRRRHPDHAAVIRVATPARARTSLARHAWLYVAIVTALRLGRGLPSPQP